MLSLRHAAMIYYDVTKMGAAKHRSGLTRVSSRLWQELGNEVTPVVWSKGFRLFRQRTPVQFGPADWLLTVELFSEAERPGFHAFVARPPCRLAAMFHDAIPLRFPHSTWPQSVQRHPDYMKLLAGFDRVFAISAASRRDLTGFWRWQGVVPRAEVSTIELGADLDGSARTTALQLRLLAPRRSLLSVGIVEPRKNQTLLLNVCEALWGEGLDFELHVVGRVNPHFGAPIAKRLKQTQRRESRMHFHEAVADTALHRLYGSARAVACPTIAEGCGLPVLEALWRGVPCVVSDLPVLRENADGGGCLVARVDDAKDWADKLRAVLTDDVLAARLRNEAANRPLPRWADTAAALRGALLGS
jgi:glycosyltransferase involved in cell wall biosynthesis